MLINKEELKIAIESNFPKIELAVAYGSGVFKQNNYNYQSQKPLIDFIFVVEDTQEWHEQNMIKFKSHYSGLSNILGSSYIQFLNNQMFPLHFNPNVIIREPSGNKEFNIKYGVISQKQFIKDLSTWNYLVLAGRMHKPVKFIIKNECNKKLQDAIETNILNAICTGLLLQFQPKFSELDFYKTITSLSYVGDVRFKLGAESKNKIDQIVEGNLENFKRIYLPVFQQSPFNQIIQHQSNSIIMDCSEKTCDFLINSIPFSLATSFTGKDKDYVQSFKLIKFQFVQNIISQAIQEKNQFSSKQMIYYNILATSPLKNLTYVFKKLQKGIFKR